MAAKTYRVEARARLADTLADKGPAYANLAASIRTGGGNLYVEAAIEALASTVRHPLDEDEA